MPPAELYKWVNEAKEGQQAAWNFLYNYFQPPLYSLALKIHGNTPAAKDAVQDSFMIAFLQLDKLKDPLAFPAWIKKILTHNCYRSVQKQRNIENKDPLPEEVPDLSFDKKLDELYNKFKLFESLEQLPEILRTTVLLRYFSKYNSYDEIATILSVPVGTVRSRLNKARTILSELWNKSQGLENISRHSEIWNKFYIWAFEEYMIKNEPRKKLLDHIDNNMLLQLTSGKLLRGKQYIHIGIEDDINYGVGHDMVNSVTSGSVSVIDFNNVNSKEYPDHCPTGSAVVIYRDREKVTRMHLYDSPR